MPDEAVGSRTSRMKRLLQRGSVPRTSSGDAGTGVALMLGGVSDARSTQRSKSREGEMIAAQTTVVDWIHLIRAEYLEIPGLHLTRNQVQRLWGLDDLTCDALLEALVDVRFLRRTRTGAYIKAD
jgi:hypothetical protein